MRPKNTSIPSTLLLAIFSILMCNTSLLAAKPPKPTPTPTPPPSPTVDLYLAPSTPPCPGLAEVTGMYQDGQGIYLPDEGVAFNSDGDLNIRPSCPANRRLNALLPAAALAQLTGPMGSCLEQGSVLLKIPGLLNAQSGVVGLHTPPGPTTHYYFIVDSNGNGRFRLQPDRDNSYNLIWQRGIWLERTEYIDRTVYDLQTGIPPTTHDADLVQVQGDQSKGTFCVPLRMIVTRMK